MKRIETIQELYSTHGVMYSYACDAIAYYIFGSKADDNIIIRAMKGVYRGSQIDSADLSQFMMDHEYCWQECVEDIDNFVADYPTDSGASIKNYF